MLFDLIRNTTSHKERTKRNLVGIHKGTLWDTGHGKLSLSKMTQQSRKIWHTRSDSKVHIKVTKHKIIKYTIYMQAL